MNATDENHTQDEQKVAKQTTKKRAVDQIKVTFSQGNSCNDKLDNVSKSCIRQSADGLTGPQRDLFGSESQKGSEENDGKSGDDEDNGVGLVSPM